MTKARDLANIISDGFTASDIPNLAGEKITSGTVAEARLPSTVINSNLDLTTLSATNLTSGTVPDSRFPATLPASSGANLTALPAGNLSGNLPAISGASLTGLNASNLGTGTVPTARLGSGTASSSTFLRGDSTYAEAGGGAWTLISTVTPSGTPSSISFTGFDSSKYEHYVFYLDNINTNRNSWPYVLLQWRTSTNGGSSYDSTSGNYESTSYGATRVGNSELSGQDFHGEVRPQSGNSDTGGDADEGITGRLEIFSPDFALPTIMEHFLCIVDGNGLTSTIHGGSRNTLSADVDAIQFSWSGHEFANQGRIRFYGIAY